MYNPDNNVNGSTRTAWNWFQSKGITIVVTCVRMFVCVSAWIWTDGHRSHTLSFSLVLASFVYFVFSYSHTPPSTASKRADEPHYNFQPEFISQNYKRTEARKLFYSQINAHFKTVQLRYSPSNGPRKLIKIVSEWVCCAQCIRNHIVCTSGWAVSRFNQQFLMIC